MQPLLSYFSQLLEYRVRLPVSVIQWSRLWVTYSGCWFNWLAAHKVQSSTPRQSDPGGMEDITTASNQSDQDGYLVDIAAVSSSNCYTSLGKWV